MVQVVSFGSGWEGSRVEERRGMPEAPVSLPRSSNRTCRFPASGFPTDFSCSPRRLSPSQAVHAKPSEDLSGGESARPLGRVMMPLWQKVAHPPLHVVVPDLIGPGQRAIGEVVLPTSQLRVEAFPYLFPWPLFPGL